MQDSNEITRIRRIKVILTKVQLIKLKIMNNNFIGLMITLQTHHKQFIREHTTKVIIHFRCKLLTLLGINLT